ncbi:putative reverse transcriptase domain-containing protein [Tanacetum coccineum]
MLAPAKASLLSILHASITFSLGYGSSGYFYFFGTYQSRVWDPLFRELSLSVLFLLRFLVTPEVGAAVVASPVWVLELDTHSPSRVDPSSDTEMPERHVSPTPHDVMLTRWRSRVASPSSSPINSTPEIPTAPIPPAPSTIVAPSTDIISPIDAPPGIFDDELFLSARQGDIPIGRLLPYFILVSLYLEYPPDKQFVIHPLPPRVVYPPLIGLPVCCGWGDAGIDMEVDIRVDVEDEVESGDRGTIEVGVDVVAGIDIPDGYASARCMKTFGNRLRSCAWYFWACYGDPSLEEDVTLRRDRKSDGDNGNDRNGNGGNRNGENGNGNPNENDKGARPVARECTYQDFMKCQPLNFKGTEGVVGFIRWFEKMETVFHISNCPNKYQVKYATCTLLNSALAWWNSHKRIVGTDAAFSIFQELTKLCTKMVPKEEDRVERFIGGLPDNIQGNVIAAEPTRLQDAVHIANNLMDQKLKGYAVKNAKNRRRLEVNQRDNHGQQPPFKRQNVGGQNVARAYTAGNNEKRGYVGPLPYCSKCKLHHEGPCTMRYGKCNKVGHLTRDCKATISTTSTHRGQVVNQRVLTCFECGRQGHYRSDFLKLKDQNCRNKTGNKSGIGEARGKAYVLGGGDANPDSNVVTDTLDISYAVELADGRVSETNTLLIGCTLGLLGHPFNIDLIPVELGSFDVIMGMDWLANHHAVIVCNEKIMWIPYGDEVLIVQVMKKETEDKSEDKRLKDVPTVRDF